MATKGKELVSLNQITNNAKSDFSTLLRKSWNLAQKYRHRYGQDDGRCDFFVAFSQLNLWLLIQLDIFSELLDPQTTKISRHMKLTANHRIVVLAQFDTINRASYCTKAMFDLEHLLVTFADGLRLSPKKNDWTYSELTRRILEDIGMTKDYEFNVLKVPAEIRNSLHNDGYTNRTFNVKIRGKPFNFVKGQRLEFTGWDNLYILFDELLAVLVKIIDNPNVQRVTQIPHTSMRYQEILPP